MGSDVVDLRDFYASPLGYVARRLLERRLREIWPDVSAQRVMGLGYAVPLLPAFGGEAERVLALMPAAQGVLAWPPGGDNQAALVQEDGLPLPDLSVDRVVLLHAVEHAEALRPLLREVWRVMTAGGRLIVIAPNRRGLWARFDRTPFGLGQPYTAGQLSRLLRDNLFTPIQVHNALYVPPFGSRLVLSAANAWERIGRRWFAGVSGVVMIEASKQLYAPTVQAPPAPAALRRPQPQPVIGHPAGRGTARSPSASD